MSFEDSTLQCVECGNNFEFTAGEQEFYQSRGLTNLPKRCPECRSARKKKYNKKGPKKLYDITCSECGVEAKVPFRPSEDRPVYCKDCFKNVSPTVQN